MTTYQPIFRSPLARPAEPVVTAGLRLSDLSGIPIILSQGEAGAVLQQQFGRLPAQPGDLVEVGQALLARLTPGQVYLFGKSSQADLPSAQALEDSYAQANLLAHTTDFSHGQAAFKLSGAQASQTLSKICGLDFHDSVFPNMRVKQTSAAKIKTLIARCDEAGEPTYHLHVSRPLGQYFWESLWDAGQEFGIGLGA
jgi:heterotetrameric sarcosine oxidase gamma subunit